MFIFLVSFFLISCEDDYYPTIQKETVIVYMVANNDLSDEAFDDINETSIIKWLTQRSMLIQDVPCDHT